MCGGELPAGHDGAPGPDYETLRASNERLIYVSITGYGKMGRGGDGGHDINYLALGGALEGTARPAGRRRFPEFRCGPGGRRMQR